MARSVKQRADTEGEEEDDEDDDGPTHRVMNAAPDASTVSVPRSLASWRKKRT